MAETVGTNIAHIQELTILKFSTSPKEKGRSLAEPKLTKVYFSNSDFLHFFDRILFP